jgi:hypothetical protein
MRILINGFSTVRLGFSLVGLDLRRLDPLLHLVWMAA